MKTFEARAREANGSGLTGVRSRRWELDCAMQGTVITEESRTAIASRITPTTRMDFKRYLLVRWVAASSRRCGWDGRCLRVTTLSNACPATSISSSTASRDCSIRSTFSSKSCPLWLKNSASFRALVGPYRNRSDAVIASLQGGSPFTEKVSNPTLPSVASRTSPQPLDSARLERPLPHPRTRFAQGNVRSPIGSAAV